MKEHFINNWGKYLVGIILILVLPISSAMYVFQTWDPLFALFRALRSNFMKDVIVKILGPLITFGGVAISISKTVSNNQLSELNKARIAAVDKMATYRFKYLEDIRFEISSFSSNVAEVIPKLWDFCVPMDPSDGEEFYPELNMMIESLYIKCNNILTYLDPIKVRTEGSIEHDLSFYMMSLYSDAFDLKTDILNLHTKSSNFDLDVIKSLKPNFEKIDSNHVKFSYESSKLINREKSYAFEDLNGIVNEVREVIEKTK